MKNRRTTIIEMVEIVKFWQNQVNPRLSITYNLLDDVNNDTDLLKGVVTSHEICVYHQNHSTITPMEEAIKDQKAKIFGRM